MKILIADDDATCTLILECMLQQAGHHVTTVADGAEAWALWSAEFFPVVIADWLMPGVDGLELSRRVRTSRELRYTYLILLTALAGKARCMEAMDAGVDDFLVKPADQELLSARLHVAERVLGLRQHVDRLEGLLPICAWCKQIRDEREGWISMERYIAERSDSRVTHSACPECSARFADDGENGTAP